MPGRRRKRDPNVYNLEIPLAVAAHSCGAQYLLAAFIKHLVFAREQCHAPFNELENHVQVRHGRCCHCSTLNHIWHQNVNAQW
jgi:hypothetical protein